MNKFTFIALMLFIWGCEDREGSSIKPIPSDQEIEMLGRPDKDVLSDMAMNQSIPVDLEVSDAQLTDFSLENMQAMDMQAVDMQAIDMQVTDMQVTDMQVTDMELIDSLVLEESLDMETLTVINHSETVSLDLPAEELPISVNKHFRCDMNGVGTYMKVASVKNSPGEDLFIVPSSDHCKFHLWLKKADQTLQQLSTEPNGYLLISGRRFSQTKAMICASKVNHNSDPEQSDPLERVVSSVDLECWIDIGEGYLPPQRIIQGNSEWVAWVRDIEPVSDDTPQINITYARDFSFQFLNFSDNGRPADDGLYSISVSLDSAGIISAGEAVKIAEKVNPQAQLSENGWTPTEVEKERFSEVINFDDGPCPQGCPVGEGVSIIRDMGQDTPDQEGQADLGMNSSLDMGI